MRNSSRADALTGEEMRRMEAPTLDSRFVLDPAWDDDDDDVSLAEEEARANGALVQLSPWAWY